MRLNFSLEALEAQRKREGLDGDGDCELMIRGLALALFVIWLAGVLLGKSGFIHILLLCSIAVAVVQWMAERRATRG